MPALQGALAEINAANAEFWRRRRQRSRAQLTNDAVRVTAFETLDVEQLRQVPLSHRLSLEQAPEDAERVGERFLAAQARKGVRRGKLTRYSASSTGLSLGTRIFHLPI